MRLLVPSSGNGIGPEGGTILARSLEKLTALQTLRIRYIMLTHARSKQVQQTSKGYTRATRPQESG